MIFPGRGAAEWNSLGRKPQVLRSRNAVAPAGATCTASSARNVAPIGAIAHFSISFLGLTPQAIACRRSAARPRGFTLLEVILALAILAGALAVLGEMARLALRNAAEARDLARAQLLAESKLAEIVAGITSTDAVDNTAFDPTTETLDPAEPAWLYSISSQATDEVGLISVRVTVTRDIPAGQHPVKFSLVRWVPDPNYTYTPPSGGTSSTSSSSVSGGP